MSEYRRDCRWFMARFAGWPHCRRKMFASPQEPPERLALGCLCDPVTEYCPIEGKANATADPNETGDPPWRRVEWEDDA